MGGKVDEFELSMNRAAEKAAPAARDIFKDALTAMTFDDARRILKAGIRRPQNISGPRHRTNSRLHSALLLNPQWPTPESDAIQATHQRPCVPAIRQNRQFRYHGLRGWKSAGRPVFHAGPGREEDPHRSRCTDYSAPERSLRKTLIF